MRKVFFSFHYVRDCWSVSQVRNSWLANPHHASQPFYDKAAWEQIKRRGYSALKQWIDSQMTGTSVTVVLIGPETLTRPWVRYEIDESIRRGKGLLGVTLENMTQSNQTQDRWTQYQSYSAFSGYPVYSWINHDGRKNLSTWIESAALKAARPFRV